MTAISNTRNGLRAVLALAALVAAFALPAQAFASSDCTNDPTAAQYCNGVEATGNEGTTEAAVTTPSAPASTQSNGTEAASSGGSLPFTGFDALSLVAAAVALTGAGFALRRLSASEGQGS